MSLYPKFRDVHLSIGLALLIPLVAIAGTGILLNHEQSLGLKPKYAQPQSGASIPAIPSAGPAARNTQIPEQDRPWLAERRAWSEHAGAIEAALDAAAGEWGQVPLDRIELKQEPGYGLVVKVKADKAAGVSPEEIVWSVGQSAVVYRKGDPQAGPNWQKFIIDLHTGKLFSQRYGFIWSDLTAASILLLGGTGVVLYLIPLLKKRAKKPKGNATPAVRVSKAGPRVPLPQAAAGEAVQDSEDVVLA